MKTMRLVSLCVFGCHALLALQLGSAHPVIALLSMFGGTTALLIMWSA